MKRIYSLALLSLFIFVNCEGEDMGKKVIKLPEPVLEGEISLEETLAERRSVREYMAEPIKLEEISQLLWAGQGITKENFYRTAPSAGALYPIELYLVADNVTGLDAGLYHYIPKGHKLKLVKKGKLLDTVADAALGQRAIKQCSALFIVTGVVERTAKKYGDRAEQYMLIEVGHVGQNILLQAQALDLGAVPMGAFYEDKMKEAFDLLGEAFYLIPVGRKTF